MTEIKRQYSLAFFYYLNKIIIARYYFSTAQIQRKNVVTLSLNLRNKKGPSHCLYFKLIFHLHYKETIKEK